VWRSTHGWSPDGGYSGPARVAGHWWRC
jgi:hypothetical protein